MAAPRTPGQPEKGVPAITSPPGRARHAPGPIDFETTGNVGTIHGARATPSRECLIEQMRSMEFEKVDALVSRARAHVDEVRERHPDAASALTFMGYRIQLEPSDPAADLIFGVLGDLVHPDPHPSAAGPITTLHEHSISSAHRRGGYNQHEGRIPGHPEMLQCAAVLEAAVRRTVWYRAVWEHSGPSYPPSPPHAHSQALELPAARRRCSDRRL
jgi:hypothetical protein